MANALSITIEDVRASYEKPIAVERVAWVEAKVDEAVRELLGFIPLAKLEADIASGKLDRGLVIDKVVGAVLRVVRNPEGIEEESEGDYRLRLRSTTASGDIWYLEKDLLLLGWQGKTKSNKPRTVMSTPSRGFGFPGGSGW